MPVADPGRYLCTADAPWSEDKGRFAQHPDATETHSGWESTSYKCPHCGATWRVYDDDIR